MMNAFGMEEHGNIPNWPETGYGIGAAWKFFVLLSYYVLK